MREEQKERKIERKILTLINKQRGKKGLSRLYSDLTLKKAARNHSNDMIKSCFEGHINKKGEDAEDRALKLKPKWVRILNKIFGYSIGENICIVPFRRITDYGSIFTSEQVAQAAVKSWMESPKHKELILEYDYTHTGVGVAYDKKKREYFVTELFERKS